MNKINSNEFYADFGALANLKTRAKTDPDGALKEVAQEFESIFINMMLKNMRAANETIGSDLFSNNESKQYQEMLDSQMAQSMAKSGGMGIADALIRQFESRNSISAASANETNNNSSQSETDFLNRVATQDLARIQALARQASAEVISKIQSEDEAAQITGVAGVQATATTPENNSMSAQDAAFNSPDEFIASLWPLAKSAAEKLGVDPKAILAQAALETGWGKYPIARQDGTASFNMFGIKADSRWSGDRAVVSTLEYQDGIAKQQKAPFRAYQSFSDSFDDYADFLLSSERYKDAILAGDDVATFADKLQQGGYATDPEYSQKIQRIAASDWFKTLL